jgi:hypothetical protein
MSAPTSDPPVSPAGRSTKAGSGDDVSRQIRGSTLLLVGRMMSLGANLVVQVLLVRHFSKADYGTSPTPCR